MLLRPPRRPSDPAARFPQGAAGRTPARGLRTLALLAVWLGAAPPPGSAQRIPTIPIRQAVLDLNGDFVPDRLGATVAVEGVVTSDAVSLAGNASVANVQDGTAGIVLFSRDTAFLVRHLFRGDSVRVQGVVGQYRGQEELIVGSYVRLGKVALPLPRNVLATDVKGERFEGRLVRVAGDLTVRENEAGEIRAVLSDRSGSILVNLADAWITEPRFAEHLRHGGKVEVVGVPGQRASSPPFDAGYILYPRDTADFSFAPIPPYREIALVMALLLVLALAWARRRAVERARSIGLLLEEVRDSKEALLASERRFRSLVENASDTMSILDADGTIRYHSPSVARMLGWTPEDLVGTRATTLVHPDDVARVEAELVALAAEPDGVRTVECRIRHKDGAWHHLEITARNRFADPTIQGLICNSRDISRQHALETRVRESERLEAIGRLAGGIAHDFNNVLTIVRGHAQLLLETLPANDPTRDEVLEIDRGAERAVRLTQQLLAFGRRQMMVVRVLDPAAVVTGMEKMLRRLIGEDIELRVVPDDGTHRIRADLAQLEQVVMNLAVNARDAMPGGGTLTIRVAAAEIGASGAEDEIPGSLRPGRYVRLSVTDTGAGMDAKTRQHIFEPFFTTKEIGAGTGLGLATVYGIVTQSGGAIDVASEIGEGTTFNVYLPAVDAAPEEPIAPPATESHPVGGCGETVLLVEDEHAVRRLARRILERAGYHVLEAESPSAALRHILNERETEIDLLLTDVVMPEMDGRELAERIEALRPGIPTIFMSGYTEDEVLRRGVATAVASFIQKPFTPAQLLEKVGASIGAEFGA